MRARSKHSNMLLFPASVLSIKLVDLASVGLNQICLDLLVARALHLARQFCDQLNRLLAEVQVFSCLAFY